MKVLSVIPLLAAAVTITAAPVETLRKLTPITLISTDQGQEMTSTPATTITVTQVSTVLVSPVTSVDSLTATGNATFTAIERPAQPIHGVPWGKITPRDANMSAAITTFERPPQPVQGVPWGRITPRDANMTANATASISTVERPAQPVRGVPWGRITPRDANATATITTFERPPQPVQGAPWGRVTPRAINATASIDHIEQSLEPVLSTPCPTTVSGATNPSDTKRDICPDIVPICPAGQVNCGECGLECCSSPENGGIVTPLLPRQEQPLSSMSFTTVTPDPPIVTPPPAEKPEVEDAHILPRKVDTLPTEVLEVDKPGMTIAPRQEEPITTANFTTVTPDPPIVTPPPPAEPNANATPILPRQLEIIAVGMLEVDQQLASLAPRQGQAISSMSFTTVTPSPPVVTPPPTLPEEDMSVEALVER